MGVCVWERERAREREREREREKEGERKRERARERARERDAHVVSRCVHAYLYTYGGMHVMWICIHHMCIHIPNTHWHTHPRTHTHMCLWYLARYIFCKGTHTPTHTHTPELLCSYLVVLQYCYTHTCVYGIWLDIYSATAHTSPPHIHTHLHYFFGIW